MFILTWFGFLFTDSAISSVDLPAHVGLFKEFLEQLKLGRLSFYDPSSFTGWGAFLFDGFIPALCTSVVSVALEYFTPDPMLLAAHSLLAIGLALLPWTFFYTSLPLAHDLTDAWLGVENKLLPKTFDFFLALLSGILSFWFINHDKHMFGIGAASVVNIGLFAQLFGWHFLLLFLGALFRIVRNPAQASIKPTAIFYALLCLSHLMTSVYASFLFAMAFLFWGPARQKIFWAGSLGFALSGFWLFPMLQMVGTYSAFDISRPEGDFLELILRYPLSSLVSALNSAANFQLDPVHLLIPVVLIGFFAHSEIRKARTLGGILLILFLSIFILSSEFTASSLPLAFHYYRFQGYFFLILSIVVAPLFLLFLTLDRSQFASIHNCFVGGLYLTCFYFVTCLPNPALQRLQSELKVPLKNENAILEYFKSLNTFGRVYFEYSNDYEKFPWLSAQYMNGLIYRSTGFETTVNTWLQRSLAYRMIAAAARKLEAHTYSVPSLYLTNSDLSVSDCMQQLKNFGVTHVVSGSQAFTAKIRAYALKNPTTFGPYTVSQIQNNPPQLIAEEKRIPIGYVDESGSLPFAFIEYYFQSRSDLYRRYVILELNPDLPMPKTIEHVLVNLRAQSLTSLVSDQTPKNVVSFSFSPQQDFNHFNIHYPQNPEAERYRQIENFLEKELNLRSRLVEIQRLPASPSHNEPKAQLTFNKAEQEIRLQGLRPGSLYRINYSYLPLWQSADGNVLRGSEERIFIIPDSDSARLYYSIWNSGLYLWGLFATLIGIGILLYRPKAVPKNAGTPSN